MRHDLFAVGVRLLAYTAAIRDILIVVLAVPNHVVQIIVRVGAFDALVLVGSGMRLHVLNHLVVRREDLITDDAKVFVVVCPFDDRCLKQIADQHVAIKSGWCVEFFIARLAQKVIPRPVLLQAHFQLGVVDDHVSADFELTDKCLATNVTVVIFLDIIPW